MNRETYTVTNSEQIELEFQLAGFGSRMIAGALDTFFMFLFLVIALIIFVPFYLFHHLEKPDSLISSFEGTFFILLVFIIYWGYHVFFEMLLKGQSPGKRICQIQVLNDDGLHPTWKKIVIRNLIRIVDGFPGVTYFIAALAMGIDPQRKRLGDMAAGTIVVSKASDKKRKSRALSACWLTEIEKGKKGQELQLPFGSIDTKTLQLIDRFLARRKNLIQEKRSQMALKIAAPLYEKWGQKAKDPEKFLLKIQKCVKEEALKGEYTKEKLNVWKKFEGMALKLGKKKWLLHKLSADQIEFLMRSYCQIGSDLARARSMQSDPATIGVLNNLAILGHQLLYENLEERRETVSLFFRFPTVVRKKMGPVALSFVLFFVPALIAYFAVLSYPELGFDLVPDEFIDFSPAKSDNIHHIPSITRPIASTGIITNNIQVTFLAFAFGLTAGLGTCYILLFNGIHLGSVVAWMQLNGNGYALWGWIMPHGATEILAIILSGAAGFLLADALLRPSNLGLRESLKRAAKNALTIELGCMGMLVIAGLIEGFVSPSSITYTARLVIFLGSIIFWGIYLFCLPTLNNSTFNKIPQII